MKNIAIISDSLDKGGAQRSAGALAKRLSERYQVYVFLRNAKDVVYDYGGTIVDLGVEGEDRVEYYLDLYKEQYKIDCAISFTEAGNFPNIKTKGDGLTILSVRVAPSTLYTSVATNRTIRDLYGYADRIVAVAHGVKYDLVKSYGIDPTHITTIYNFIDKDGIRRKAGESVDADIRSFIGNSRLILNVGRFDTEKNQKKLLVQFAKLLHSGEDAKLILLGKDGGLKADLKRLIDKLGIGGSAKLVDFVSNPFPLYQSADVLAVTSRSEGLPNAVMEAMLLGTPVVSVDCLSGPRELLKGSLDYVEKIKGVEICKNGILVEPVETDETGETSFFKNALAQLLHDRDLYISIAENARAFMDRYSNETILEQWIDIIENTVKREDARLEIRYPVLEQAKKIIVYGAGNIGRVIMRRLLPRKEELEMLCFAVTDKSGNPNKVLDIPVYEIGELLAYREDAIVVIGVSGRYSNEVAQYVEQMGFQYTYTYDC